MLRRNSWKIWGWSIGLALTTLVAATQGLTDKHMVIKQVPTTHKVVALTVDDGPHDKTTPQMLAVLREKKVRLTLFVLGSNVEKHPEILAQAVADGHEIASHGYSHRLLTKLSRAECEAEMDKAEKLITAAAPKPVLFRPPGGSYNDLVLKVARNHGYTPIIWSIDPKDWQRPSVDKVVNNVLTNVKPGSIVLLHDGQYPLPTPEAIGIIIDRLREAGYSIVTVSELLQYYEVNQ